MESEDVYAKAREEYPKVIREQAAEIMRLRTVLEEAASDMKMSLQIDVQKDAEIERLRAALDKMQRSRNRYRQAWEAEKTRAALAQGGDA